MFRTRRWWLALACAVVVLDQVTKSWALGALDNGRTVHIVWTLRFALGFNSGMAFSRAEGWGPVIGVAATVVLVYLLASLRRAGSLASVAGLSLVIGGACGNLVDRLFRGDAWMRGSVVDFIDLRWWPVFNVADSAITVGAVFLVLSAFRDPARSSDGGDGEGAT
ncbi:MAG: signal peptidase [Actinomycetota bacterium]|jgi:signal peptidase II